MRFDCLTDWLNWQETLNPAEIDLGLDRVTRVLQQAGLSTTFNCPLIIVAGTNGKGSVVAMLEAMAMAAGLKVCSYTSPHIFQYNERIKINGLAIDDASLCQAFARIDEARGDSQLTYFEFGTLAAIDVFFRAAPDLVIMEVGLGGRLDAVNIMDADVSVLTSVAIDHIDWLGADRESIGFEKAGVFRAGKPVVCGEIEPPATVLQQADKLQCEFIQAGKHYRVLDQQQNGRWTLQSCYGDISDLPQPFLTGEFQKLNAATAIVALQVLQANALFSFACKQQPGFQETDSLTSMIPFALRHVRLPGRFQLINTRPQVYVDVAHNLQAARALATQIQSTRLAIPAKNRGDTWAIVAMLSDKDISGVLDSVAGEIDHWCFCGLDFVSRGASLRDIVKNLPVSISAAQNRTQNLQTAQDFQGKNLTNQCTMLTESILLAKTVTDACRQVLSKASKHDLIIIFGSFYTVAEAMSFFKLNDDAVETIN